MNYLLSRLQYPTPQKAKSPESAKETGHSTERTYRFDQGGAQRQLVEEYGVPDLIAIADKYGQRLK